MQDPKFEKEVQERMEGLQFNPSDQVWVRLERELNKEKRRSLPLFWPLFLLGGILIGAGGVWFFIGGSGHSAGAQKTAGYHAASPARGRVSAGPTSSSPATRYAPDGDRYGAASALSPRSGVRKQEEQTLIGSIPGGNPAEDGVSDRVPDLVRSGIAFTSAGAKPSTDHSVFMPLPFIGNAPKPGVPSHSEKNAVMYKRPVWQAGFSGGTGISSLEDQGMLAGQSASLSGLSTTPATQYGGRAAAPSYFTAKVSPDFSFWAGVFIQKPIGRRLSLSAGLNLHYYSYRITTGQQVVSNSPYPTPSLFYPSAIAASSQVYPYYPPGDNTTYLNRYYFLELPLSLQWQFNKSDKIPLFAEGGLSLVRVMSANALFYDERSGAYYKYGSSTSGSFQLFGSAALLAGFRWGATRIQAGPQIQYGLSSLIKPGIGPEQHLIYGGIKLTVIPGWK